MIFDLFAFLFLGLVTIFWVTSAKAREIGVSAARSACEKEGIQFLDDTVVSAGVRVRRNERGHLCLQRSYAFEFSVTGNDRQTGGVTLLAYDITMLDTGPHRNATDQEALQSTPPQLH